MGNHGPFPFVRLPPRKYYAITDAGRQRLDKQAAEWREFVEAVDAILAGSGTSDAQAEENHDTQ